MTARYDRRDAKARSARKARSGAMARFRFFGSPEEYMRRKTANSLRARKILALKARTRLNEEPRL